MGDFDGFSALSFDCYGTLIDWDTGITAALQAWADRCGTNIPIDMLLDWFGEIESHVEAGYLPALLYPDVLAETLRRIGGRAGAPVTDEDAALFGGSVGDWPTFSDSAEALRRLSERFKLIVVSNVDRASFARSNERLGVEFDAIITAEDVGSYKPADPHFDALFAALPGLGVEPGQLLHVAESLYHDHEPAARRGLPSVWIHRRHDQSGHGATHAPDAPIEPKWRFASMAELAAAAVGG